MFIYVFIMEWKWRK